MAIVDLPDFNEFLDSMDEDEMGREIESLAPMHIIQFPQNDPVAFQNAMNMLHRETMTRSVKISLLFLRKYHEWLQENP